MSCTTLPLRRVFLFVKALLSPDSSPAQRARDAKKSWCILHTAPLVLDRTTISSKIQKHRFYELSMNPSRRITYQSRTLVLGEQLAPVTQSFSAPPLKKGDLLSRGETKDLRQISKQDRVRRGRDASLFLVGKKYETLVAPGQNEQQANLHPPHWGERGWIIGLAAESAVFAHDLRYRFTPKSGWVRGDDATLHQQPVHIFSAPKHRGDKNIWLLYSGNRIREMCCSLWEFVLLHPTFVLQSETDDNIHATWTQVYWGAVAVIFLRASEAEAVLN